MIQCAFTSKHAIHLQSWQIVFSHGIAETGAKIELFDSMAWSMILTTVIMTANLKFPWLILYFKALKIV